MIICLETDYIKNAMAEAKRGINSLAEETGLPASTVKRILKKGSGQHAKVLAIVYALDLDPDDVTFIDF